MMCVKGSAFTGEKLSYHLELLSPFRGIHRLCYDLLSPIHLLSLAVISFLLAFLTGICLHVKYQDRTLLLASLFTSKGKRHSLIFNPWEGCGKCSRLLFLPPDSGADPWELKVSGVRPQEVRLSDSGIITHEDSSAGQILLALHNFPAFAVWAFLCLWFGNAVTRPLHYLLRRNLSHPWRWRFLANNRLHGKEEEFCVKSVVCQRRPPSSCFKRFPRPAWSRLTPESPEQCFLTAAEKEPPWSLSVNVLVSNCLHWQRGAETLQVHVTSCDVRRGEIVQRLIRIINILTLD